MNGDLIDDIIQKKAALKAARAKLKELNAKYKPLYRGCRQAKKHRDDAEGEVRKLRDAIPEERMRTLNTRIRSLERKLAKPLDPLFPQIHQYVQLELDKLNADRAELEQMIRAEEARKAIVEALKDD